MLPEAYHEVGEELHITPTQLGMITLGVGISSNVSKLPSRSGSKEAREHLAHQLQAGWHSTYLTSIRPLQALLAVVAAAVATAVT